MCDFFGAHVDIWMNLHFSYQDVVVPYLAIFFFENLKPCLLDPLFDLSIGWMVMINLFIRKFSVDNWQPSVLRPIEGLPDFVLIGILDSFGCEIEVTRCFKCLVKIGKHKWPIFRTYMFHRIHTNRAIKYSLLSDFLQTDLLKLDSGKFGFRLGKALVQFPETFES